MGDNEGQLQGGFWGFQKPVRSDRDTLIEQSVHVQYSYQSSVANYEVVNKNLCMLYQWKLLVSGQHPAILSVNLLFFFFFGLHLKSSYAFDQKPVTKNPGAAYDNVKKFLIMIRYLVEGSGVGTGR